MPATGVSKVRWSVRGKRQQTALVAMSDIRSLGTILSVWAHPDDAADLCGGIIAMAAEARSHVVCVTAARGELGVTDPTGWPPEQLAVIREADLAESLRILGVTKHRWLDYLDGGCAFVGEARYRRIIRVERFGPLPEAASS